MKILALNGGSSSFKASLFEVHGNEGPAAPRPLWNASVDWQHHQGEAEIRAKTANASASRKVAIHAPLESLEPLLEMLWSGDTQVLRDRSEIEVVGNRVVHGGRAFRESIRVNPEVRADIGRMASFAPEHNRLELEAMDAVGRILGPRVVQVAVFDTAFHASLPEPAYVYPGPYEWLDQDIRRYGFHGISYQYTSRRAADILGKPLQSLRMIVCHLGNGASLAAIRGGLSVDTTMGFTPLEGLMMGTRSGSIDPGIVIHLVRHAGYGADDLDRVLNKESGLMGVSGVSGDMREIMAAIARGEKRAQLAFDLYVHRLCSEIGSMLASLGGLDVLVFTAGVGENSPEVRSRVSQALAFLGVQLDTTKNEQSPIDMDISGPGATVRTLVVKTQEEWEIARESYRVASS